MSAEALIAPKTFISYSWSSPTHEAWVLNLASRLREDGVDVVLDKWDLKPGHDSIVFMESMVTDKTVTKVIMICDRVYASKADARSGGVGTESQIISPEIYRNSQQDKFAAAITELNEDGKACLPTFYTGRIYFDFTTGQAFEESYEQLLRWLVDKPRHVKPKLGTMPQHLLSAKPAAAATQSRARRAEEAIRQGAANAAAYIREYGDSLIPELRALAPQIGQQDEPDEKIIESAETMRPYVRQFVEICAVAARYSEVIRVWESILLQVERVGKLMYRDPEVANWNRLQFDAYKIIAHDIFLSLVAVALEEDRFDLALAVLTRPWFVRDNEGSNRQSTSDFTVFNQHVDSLTRRNQRLQLGRFSLHADILAEAHPQGSTPSLDALLQADFVIFMRSIGLPNQARWYPFPLLLSSDNFRPFPAFARSESSEYFMRLAPVLGVSDIAEFKHRVVEFQHSPNGSQMFGHYGLPVQYLANVDFIGSRL